MRNITMAVRTKSSASRADRSRASPWDLRVEGILPVWRVTAVAVSRPERVLIETEGTESESAAEVRPAAVWQDPKRRDHERRDRRRSWYRGSDDWAAVAGPRVRPLCEVESEPPDRGLAAPLCEEPAVRLAPACPLAECPPEWPPPECEPPEMGSRRRRQDSLSQASVESMRQRPFLSPEADIPQLFCTHSPASSTETGHARMEPLLLDGRRASRGRHRALSCMLRAPLSLLAPLAGIRPRTAGRCVCQRQLRDRSHAPLLDRVTRSHVGAGHVVQGGVGQTQGQVRTQRLPTRV
jgi:hypothetical protein